MDPRYVTEILENVFLYLMCGWSVLPKLEFICVVLPLLCSLGHLSQAAMVSKTACFR